MNGSQTGNIARQIGISRQTLWRWQKLPAFIQLRRELEQHRRDELREQAAEVMRLCLVSFTRELSLADNERYRNPLDAAMNIFRIMKTMQPTEIVVSTTTHTAKPHDN